MQRFMLWVRFSYLLRGRKFYLVQIIKYPPPLRWVGIYLCQAPTPVELTIPLLLLRYLFCCWIVGC